MVRLDTPNFSANRRFVPLGAIFWPRWRRSRSAKRRCALISSTCSGVKTRSKGFRRFGIISLKEGKALGHFAGAVMMLDDFARGFGCGDIGEAQPVLELADLYIIAGDNLILVGDALA